MWPLSWSIFLALLPRSSCLGHFSIDFVVSRGPCPLSFPRLSPTLGQQLLSQLELFSILLFLILLLLLSLTLGQQLLSQVELYSLETAHWKWNRRQLNVFCFLVEDDDNLISFQKLIWIHRLNSIQLQICESDFLHSGKVYRILFWMQPIYKRADQALEIY